MKNGRKNRRGFVLIFVIVIIAIIEMYMIILTGNANTFIFQADRAYIEACRQNLTESGLTWAKKNISSSKAAGSVIELDTRDMNIKKSALKVAVIVGEKETVQVEINTSCTRGRQTITSSEKFTQSKRPDN
jgi:hypothetical protein